MKLNAKTKIVGKNVVLVPYRREHVLKYNKWLENEELQVLTDSEHLSLDKEYEMQQCWRQNENMLIFIILDKTKYFSCLNENLIARECESMCGDVNLFIMNDTHEGEIDIMIAEHTLRGKGFGKEALNLLLYYTCLFLPQINTLVAKINDTNHKSIRLFERIGFTKESTIDVFKQVCLKYQLKNEKSTKLNNVFIDLNYSLE